MINILNSHDAVKLVRSNDVLFVGGNGGMGVPEALLSALGQRFLHSREPRAITLAHVTGIGAVTEKGLCHLAQDGLVGCVIGGNFGLQLPFMELIRNDRLRAYNFPQGVISQMTRALASGQPGVITHVGLDTYVDPRLEGGKMNDATKDDLIEVISMVGQEWLFYRMPRPNVAFIRGTTADEDGYVSMEHEATTREDLSIAQAVRSNGGIVICQVKRLARRGTLHPQLVKIPGYLIDHFVIDSEQMQTYSTSYEPSRSGETKAPLTDISSDPLSLKRIIARRAALELRPGDVVNLGVGVSAMIPNVVAEEGISDDLTLTVESGVIGGVPGYGREFGSAVNPRAIIDQPYQFDFYDGGGLDCAFVSFAEVDREGNVNVTRFGDRADGAGGFINITQNAERVVFSGLLTGGKSDILIEDGKLLIRTDGNFNKFVDSVGQVSFSARRAVKQGKKALYITERAVFELSEAGLTLIEIAPGVRLHQDVIDRMGFQPVISDSLKPMDPRLFADERMGLDRERWHPVKRRRNHAER